MKIVYTIIIMVVVLFIITFSMNNAETVRIDYYNFINMTVPLYLVIFISFGAGLIFAGFVGIGERFRLSRRVSKLNKKIREQEARMPVSFEESQTDK